MKIISGCRAISYEARTETHPQRGGVSAVHLPLGCRAISYEARTETRDPAGEDPGCENFGCRAISYEARTETDKCNRSLYYYVIVG
ncbi:MAG: hypothetical protein QW639_06445, partial [Candidatus Bathyarchaeia archaeon]